MLLWRSVTNTEGHKNMSMWKLAGPPPRRPHEPADPGRTFMWDKESTQ